MDVRRRLSAVVLLLFVPFLVGRALGGYIDESFTGTTAPDWTFVTGQGNGPSLTGGDEDPDGNGWLRLTDDVTNQASFVYYNNSIPTDKVLVAEFDFVTWSTTSSVADGFVLAIFDADATPDAGAYGGSLGYAQRTNEDGLAGGIAGFGFDEFGNFSNDTEGREGGPGQVQNAVVLRGSQGDNRQDGYEYQTGTDSLTDFSTTSATSRDDATIHRARITIPTDKRVSVEWKPEDGSWTTLIDQYQCTLTCPASVKIGFTAGTGSVTAYHEIRNLSVRAHVPEPGTALLGALGGLLMVLVPNARRLADRVFE